MMDRSESVEDWAVLRYSFCSRVTSVSRTSAIIPMMPCIGVRISWLMRARNSLLAWFAASAASLASASSAVRS